MIEVKEFTISRSEWLRGEGPGRSALLRKADGKRCCVGIYGKACGVPDEYMAGLGWPVMGSPHAHVNEWFLPKDHFLFSHIGTRVGLARLNDDVYVSDREEQIIEWFAEHGGVTVTFVD